MQMATDFDEHFFGKWSQFRLSFLVRWSTFGLSKTCGGSCEGNQLLGEPATICEDFPGDADPIEGNREPCIYHHLLNRFYDFLSRRPDIESCIDIYAL